MSYSNNPNSNQQNIFQDELLKLLDSCHNGKDDDIKKLLSKLDSVSYREKGMLPSSNNNAVKHRRSNSISSKNTANAASQLNNSKDSTKIYDRSYKFEELREEKIQNMKISLMMDQMQDCTHAPKINNKQCKKTEKNIIRRTEEIIYKKQEKIHKKREEMHKRQEQEMDVHCTFKPTINRKNNKCLVKTKRDVNDLMAWQKQKDDRLFDSLLEKSKREQQLTTFIPNISDNSKKIADGMMLNEKRKRIEDRIYEKPHTIASSLHRNSSQKGYSPINSNIMKSESNTSKQGYVTSFKDTVEVTSFPFANPLPHKIEYESISQRGTVDMKHQVNNKYNTIDARFSPYNKDSSRSKQSYAHK